MSNAWSWKLLRAGSLRLDGGGMFGVVVGSTLIENRGSIVDT
jgi:hypothetical protein